MSTTSKFVTALDTDAAAAEPETRDPKAQRDPLTGLYDQQYLSLKLEKLLEKSRNEPIAATLALLQLENFYEIRTWVGKPEANLLLSDIAQLLEKTLPKSVVLCHCQHYEFAVLLFNECSLNARLITDRVKTALQSAVSNSIPPQLELKCGIGLAVIDSQIPSAEVMFARARRNLSHSHGGSNPELQPWALSSTKPHSGLQQIQHSLKQKNLSLSFQPIVSLQASDLEYYEIRSSLPATGSRLSASLVFELAVQNALGESLDRVVIGKALQLLQQNRSHRLHFNINLTLNSLVSPSFFSWLGEKLEDHPGLGEHLLFQISEIDVLIAQHHMNYFSEKLNDLQIKLSINHFGCTADPFRYLPLLRAHFVKLDVSLLKKVNVDTVRREQLGRTVSKLHDHGLRVIAGMVENMSLVPLLWKAEVNFVQGYCMQKPASTLDFEFLNESALS